MKRPAFRDAWEQIKATAPGSFEELRQLEIEQFRVDPWLWGRAMLPRLRRLLWRLRGRR